MFRIPPALLRDSNPMEAGAILDEIEDGLGLLLWRRARDVALWTDTPAHRRGEIFAQTAKPGAGVEELREPVSVLARMVQESTVVTEEEVADACREIARWAESSSYLATALAYTQAAALLQPTDAETARQVGRLARRRAEYARAETWFRRAIYLARRFEAWETYSRAYMGLGTVYRLRGNLPKAERCHRRAAVIAHKWRRRGLAGEAFHELSVIATERDHIDRAETYIARAVIAYGPKHPMLPRLAADVARLRMTQGRFAHAVAILRALLPRLSDPLVRLSSVANLVQSAGAAGLSEEFGEAWGEAGHLLTYPGAEAIESAVYAALARGCMGMRDWRRAEAMAETAVRTAYRRGESKVWMEAESILEAIRSERAAEENQRERMDEQPETDRKLIRYLATV